MIHGFDDSDKSKVEVLAKSQAATKGDISNFQSQLDGKSPSGHNHDERYYTESEINTKLNSKQDNITGAASSIASANLTPNRALVSNGNGKVSAGNATAAELAYLTGLTGSVQGQLNQKANKSEIPAVPSIPSNYKIKAGSKVMNISGQFPDVFTNSEINSLLGVNNSVPANTTVYLCNGDANSANRISVLATNAINGAWEAHLSSAFSGNFRFNYIIVYFG